MGYGPDDDENDSNIDHENDQAEKYEERVDDAITGVMDQDEEN